MFEKLLTQPHIQSKKHCVTWIRVKKHTSFSFNKWGISQKIEILNSTYTEIAEYRSSEQKYRSCIDVHDVIR